GAVGGARQRPVIDALAAQRPVVAEGIGACGAVRQASTGHAGDAASPAFASATGTIASRATPFLTAVISARIDTAISGGVRLPMKRPIGPCSRAISAGV